MCCNKTSTLAHGAIGVAKAALGFDRADEATVEARRNACRDCEHATRNPKRLDRPTKGLTTLSKCGLCKCYIAAKTANADEKCPLGKW
jgi:hypothetical protein